MPQAHFSSDEFIRTVSVTESTNDDVAALAERGAPEGSWLRADRQTGGRGRQGRQWESQPGNLYCSTLVRLRVGDPEAPSLSLVAAVALHDVTQTYAPDVPLMLKWPNDLLVSGAKLAGILLERREDAVIVGIGVNLAEYPVGIERAATSLRHITGSGPDPQTFLEQLACSFAEWLARWRSEGIEAIRRSWLTRAHPVGTALSTTDAEGKRIDGLFDGLDRSGALRLRLSDGTIETVQAGDVFLI